MKKINERQSKALFYRAVKDCMVELLGQPVGKSKERIKNFRKAIKDDSLAMHEDPYKLAYDFVHGRSVDNTYCDRITAFYQESRPKYRKIMVRHYGRTVLKYL